MTYFSKVVRSASEASKMIPRLDRSVSNFAVVGSAMKTTCKYTITTVTVLALCSVDWDSSWRFATAQITLCQTRVSSLNDLELKNAEPCRDLSTAIDKHCDIHGLKCLNDNYEELTVVIPHWSQGRKGVVCEDCLPSCTEVDISVVHDWKEKLVHQDNSRNCYKIAIIILHLNRIDSNEDISVAHVEISPMTLPTERYKRNVVRGRLDLVGEWIL